MTRLRRSLRALPLISALVAACTPAAPVATRASRAPVEPAPPVRTAAPANPRAAAPPATAPSLRPRSARELALRARPWSVWQAPWLEPVTRDRTAVARRTEAVKVRFERAGVAFPPAELLLRAFKKEGTVEVWASSAPGEAMSPIVTYQVCAASGRLGPKRREGDQQVPEGYYRLAYLWPNSAFHLAMKVGYPNVADKVNGRGGALGGNIMIHGGCASIGCLAMGDEAIEELWTMARGQQRRAPRGAIQVHLLPARERAALRGLPEEKVHGAFWDNLYEGDARFRVSRRPPRVKVGWDGVYRFPATSPPEARPGKS